MKYEKKRKVLYSLSQKHNNRMMQIHFVPRPWRLCYAIKTPLLTTQLSRISIAVPGGGQGAIGPPSFQDLGKIQIFRAVTKKYLGKTRIILAAISKIWAKTGILGQRQ